ncbi:unnamed protein product [Pleuronectes platessa]|uniref:Uncharacterized protein n=1 Tax=Pleuronectes platessa TaxID=8262 RepID=A0A9N7U8L7_PLEPL|nr:unnamed protein product [Pleuronectes platessa]
MPFSLRPRHPLGPVPGGVPPFCPALPLCLPVPRSLPSFSIPGGVPLPAAIGRVVTFPPARLSVACPLFTPPGPFPVPASPYCLGWPLVGPWRPMDCGAPPTLSHPIRSFRLPPHAPCWCLRPPSFVCQALSWSVLLFIFTSLPLFTSFVSVPFCATWVPLPFIPSPSLPALGPFHLFSHASYLASAVSGFVQLVPVPALSPRSPRPRRSWPRDLQRLPAFRRRVASAPPPGAAGDRPSSPAMRLSAAVAIYRPRSSVLCPACFSGAALLASQPPCTAGSPGPCPPFASPLLSPPALSSACTPGAAGRFCLPASGLLRFLLPPSALPWLLPTPPLHHAPVTSPRREPRPALLLGHWSVCPLPAPLLFL